MISLFDVLDHQNTRGFADTKFTLELKLLNFSLIVKAPDFHTFDSL